MAARPEDLTSYYYQEPPDEVGGGVISELGEVAPLNLFHDDGEPQVTPEDAISPLRTMIDNQRKILLAVDTTKPGAEDRIQTLESQIAAQEAVLDAVEYIHSLSPQEQIATVDDLSYKIFDHDLEAQENIRIIGVARTKGDESTQRDVSARQQAIFQRIRRDIATICDVALEDEESQDAEFRPNLISRIIVIAQETGTELTYDDLIRKLGFVVDIEGEPRFTFPEDVFPPHIAEKWESYSEAIEAHLSVRDQFERGLSNPDEVVTRDLTRRVTHNALARAIQNFMQLENWDFEKYRHFVTKMVDHKIPTVDTSESTLTGQAIWAFARTSDETKVLHALGKLHSSK